VGRLAGAALSVGVAATGAGVGEAAAGAQAEASKTANRLRVRKMREVVIESPFLAILTPRLHSGLHQKPGF